VGYGFREAHTIAERGCRDPDTVGKPDDAAELMRRIPSGTPPGNRRRSGEPPGERIGAALDHLNRRDLPGKALVGLHMDRVQVFRLADQLAGHPAGLLKQHGDGSTHHCLLCRPLLPVEKRLQALQPFVGLGRVHLLAFGGWRSGTR
jgi:hypothetical protein